MKIKRTKQEPKPPTSDKPASWFAEVLGKTNELAPKPDPMKLPIGHPAVFDGDQYETNGGDSRQKREMRQAHGGQLGMERGLSVNGVPLRQRQDAEAAEHKRAAQKLGYL